MLACTYTLTATAVRCSAWRGVSSTRKSAKPILVPIHYNKDDDVAERMMFAKAKAWQQEEKYRIVAHEGIVGDEFPIVDGRYVSFPQAWGLRRARMAALALEHQYVSHEVVGQSDDSDPWARRHHPVIVASVGRRRPSSGKASPTLYEAL